MKLSNYTENVTKRTTKSTMNYTYVYLSNVFFLVMF